MSKVNTALLFCYVYILKMSNGKLYIGSTRNLCKRIEEHKRSGKEFVLVYY
ncbi:MAG: GIY-YIG nuclease family protein [Candidatus Paceibacteria bacterium]